MNSKMQLTLGTTLAATLAVGASLAFADNPFSAEKISNTPMQLADNKADSEMKCGAGMCGGNTKKADEKASDDGESCPSDTDKDGKVTKDEFLKYHETLFNEADANKDGSLDAEERKALHSKMGEGKCGGKTAS